MPDSLWTSLLAAAVSAGTPILFAALGELLCEKAGVLNLGVEGMMLTGAVAGFLVTAATGSLALGVAAAMAAGGALSLVHAVLSISLGANQVISGLALALFGTGVSSYLGKQVIGVPLPAVFPAVDVPVLSSLPVVGDVFFRKDLLVYASYLLVPALWFFLGRTRPGMNVRAAGESPETADALGIRVGAVRYACVVAGGALAGLGGAYLSLVYTPCWIENMTAGRGWIAIALVIFAAWSPPRAMLGAYLFGGIDVLGFRIQTLGIAVPTFFLKMLPYLFTVAVLILFTLHGARRRRVPGPAALGKPYERESS